MIRKQRHLFLYGVLLALLVLALKWLEWKYLILDHSLNIYIGIIAVFFTLLGIWIATQLARPGVKTVIVEKVLPPDPVTINEAELKKLDLSNREYEVLQLLAKGYSNAEIGNTLFLSLSTVKTHVSNLFAKMEVKSRTQALEKARRLHIVP